MYGPPAITINVNGNDDSVICSGSCSYPNLTTTLDTTDVSPSNTAPSNVPKPAQVLHFWQKPGCGSAIGETAIGAVTTGSLAAGIWFLGPEALAIAGEAVVETAVTEGPLAAGMDLTHLASAAGVLAAAPLVTLGHGISNVATSCF
jgi:hypothetical protein